MHSPPCLRTFHFWTFFLSDQLAVHPPRAPSRGTISRLFNESKALKLKTYVLVLDDVGVIQWLEQLCFQSHPLKVCSAHTLLLNDLQDFTPLSLPLPQWPHLSGYKELDKPCRKSPHQAFPESHSTHLLLGSGWYRPKAGGRSLWTHLRYSSGALSYFIKY